MPAVFGAYLIGFIIESDGRRIDGTPSRKEVLLNSAHALVFHAADLSIGVLTVPQVRASTWFDGAVTNSAVRITPPPALPHFTGTFKFLSKIACQAPNRVFPIPNLNPNLAKPAPIQPFRASNPPENKSQNRGMFTPSN
jgi:hypothetical protein